MKNRHQSIIERLSRTLAGAVTWALLLSFGAAAFAQSSVEKGETSQQAREPESELERARAIVAKPGDNKPARPETGRMWGVYSTTTTFEIGHRFVDTDGSRPVRLRSPTKSWYSSTAVQGKPVRHS